MLPAVLSLNRTAASAAARSVMPSSTFASVIGELGSNSSAPYVTISSSSSSGTVFSRMPAASALNVDAKANRSSAR